MKQLLFLGIVFLIGAGIFWHSIDRGFPRTASFDGKTYQLEVATTQEERAQGLSDRGSLCDRCGMLFLFEEPGELTFWMKGMRFPLDIVWLLDGTVVHLEKRVPPDFPEIRYQNAKPANQVLELNVGETDGLEVGEQVEFFP